MTGVNFPFIPVHPLDCRDSQLSFGFQLMCHVAALEANLIHRPASPGLPDIHDGVVMGSVLEKLQNSDRPVLGAHTA